MRWGWVFGKSIQRPMMWKVVVMYPFILFRNGIHVHVWHVYVHLSLPLCFKYFFKIFLSADFVLNSLCLIKTRRRSIRLNWFLAFSWYRLFYFIIFFSFMIASLWFFSLQSFYRLFQRLFIDCFQTFTVNTLPFNVCKTLFLIRKTKGIIIHRKMDVKDVFGKGK